VFSEKNHWSVNNSVPSTFDGKSNRHYVCNNFEFLQSLTAVKEMVMAVWLIIKGFNPSAIASFSSSCPNNEQNKIFA